MTRNDLVSVIIPAYNGEDFVGKAIDSVLEQTYKNIEIIVVDDASVDGTVDFVRKKYRKNPIVRVYRNRQNCNVGVTTRNGYRRANGAYIVVLGQDDYYTNPDFFAHAVDILKRNKSLSFVSSSATIWHTKENIFKDNILSIKGLILRAEYLENFQMKYPKAASTFTTVFRKSALDKANLMKMEMMNDSSIYLRALLVGDAYILDEISGVYRVHGKNMTFNLSTDFIIENLEEKHYVYQQIKLKKILKDPDEWLSGQVLLTAEYFVAGNYIPKREFQKLLDWCQKNCASKSDVVVTRLKTIYANQPKPKLLQRIKGFFS